MTEIIMIRCGCNSSGQSLYRVTVNGQELTPLLTLAETIGALWMVEKAEGRG